MTFSTFRRDQRGIALPVAIFALVVIGTLVAGVFFTARLEMRGGESAMSATRASEAAQAGLQVAVPNTVTLGATLTDGQSVTGTSTQIGTSAAYYTYTITRLNYYVYLVRSLGEYKVNGTTIARRTMAQLVKRYMPEININSGATVVGAPSVKGSAVIDGNDHTPTGWTNCGTPGAAVPAVRTNSTDTNQIQKASNLVTGSGTPEIVGGDTSVSNMSAVLDTLFYQLAAQANITLNVADGATLSADPDPNTAGTCNKANTYNWGDPTRNTPAHACENYFPIVYVNPAMTGGLHGSVKIHFVGQGVLLVNGDFEVNASSNFNGLILARGEFGKANGNATITGSVIAQNADIDATGAGVTGNITVNFSRCAVTTALNNLSVSAPTQYRGFMQF